MENSSLQFSECRKVTIQKCFKHSHALMLKRNLGRVTGKTEPTEKFGKLNWWKSHISHFLSVNRNGLSALAIMKKCHVININHMEIFQITNSPKFGSLVSRVLIETEYQHLSL